MLTMDSASYYREEDGRQPCCCSLEEGEGEGIRGVGLGGYHGLSNTGSTSHKANQLAKTFVGCQTANKPVSRLVYWLVYELSD